MESQPEVIRAIGPFWRYRFSTPLCEVLLYHPCKIMQVESVICYLLYELLNFRLLDLEVP